MKFRRFASPLADDAWHRISASLGAELARLCARGQRRCARPERGDSHAGPVDAAVRATFQRRRRRRPIVFREHFPEESGYELVSSTGGRQVFTLGESGKLRQFVQVIRRDPSATWSVSGWITMNTRRPLSSSTADREWAPSRTARADALPGSERIGLSHVCDRCRHEWKPHDDPTGSRTTASRHPLRRATRQHQCADSRTSDPQSVTPGHRGKDHQQA